MPNGGIGLIIDTIGPLRGRQNVRGRSDLIFKKRYQIVFDIETDGSKTSRVCQLSYLMVSRWRVKAKNM